MMKHIGVKKYTDLFSCQVGYLLVKYLLSLLVLVDNINADGHKIQPSPKIPEDLWKRSKLVYLLKSIYGDGQKVTIS